MRLAIANAILVRFISEFLRGALAPVAVLAGSRLEKPNPVPRHEAGWTDANNESRAQLMRQRQLRPVLECGSTPSISTTATTFELAGSAVANPEVRGALAICARADSVRF